MVSLPPEPPVLPLSASAQEDFLIQCEGNHYLLNNHQMRLFEPTKSPQDCALVKRFICVRIAECHSKGQLMFVKDHYKPVILMLPDELVSDIRETYKDRFKEVK